MTPSLNRLPALLLIGLAGAAPAQMDCNILSRMVAESINGFAEIRQKSTFSQFSEPTGWITSFRLPGSEFCYISKQPSLVCNYPAFAYEEVVDDVGGCLDPALWDRRMGTHSEQSNQRFGDSKSADRVVFVEKARGVAIRIWRTIYPETVTVEISPP
jgi:hypothetical protein